MNRAMKIYRALVLTLLAAAGTAVAFAPAEGPSGGQSASTGAVKGFVRDTPAGTPVPAVRISLVSVSNATVKFDIRTDKKGYYYIGGLIPGYYTFSLEKAGFLPASQTIRAPLGEAAECDFALQPLASDQGGGSGAARTKGMAAFKTGNWDEAVKEFTEAVTAEGGNPALYFYRAVSQENRGKASDALVDYQRAVEVKPDFFLAYARAAKIYARQKNYDKALSYYQKALELGDPDITTLFNSAIVLMNLGNGSEATAALESLLKRDPEYADAYYHLGILSIGRGEADKAKTFFQKFLQLDPANPNAALAKQILAGLG